jgi:hypothetical protein
MDGDEGRPMDHWIIPDWIIIIMDSKSRSELRVSRKEDTHHESRTRRFLRCSRRTNAFIISKG